MENLIGKKFKSIKAINYNTPRGQQNGNIEGEIILVEKNVFTLKGLMYDFEITRTQFNMLNKF